MSENILEINNLSKYFGGLAAVSDCSLKVKKGTITGIIGPNGSGKTTLFNLIAGNLKSSSGNVLFNNADITDVPSYELFSKGLLRTFQIAHEFTNLSVLENLMMVPGNQSGENLVNALFKPGIVRNEELIKVLAESKITLLAMDCANIEANGGDSIIDFMLPKTVIFCHWENFFRRKDQPPREIVKVNLSQLKRHFDEDPRAQYIFPDWDTHYSFPEP